LIQPREQELDLPGVNSPALSPDEAKERLSEMGENWVYGEGLGDTGLQIGVAFAFPPYALVMVANGVLALSGYEPVTVSSLLPEPASKVWKQSYGGLVSGPGRFVAAVAGEEFRTEERIKAVNQARVQKNDESNVLANKNPVHNNNQKDDS